MQKFESPDTKIILDAIQKERSDIDKRLDKLTSEVKALRHGFPEGDPESHRRYHESVIEWQDTRNELVKGALMQAGKVGFIAAIGWVVYAIWIALKMELQK